jgi:23S rRNA (uridine2552-2'-O)-methyltransferase
MDAHTSRNYFPMSRSKSSQQWLKEHHDDSFVLKARREGYRSRAVYKLEEIQKKDQIIHPGQNVIDLGAAPGGWCEFVSAIQAGNGFILGVDLLAIDPIPDVELIQGDFTDTQILDDIGRKTNGKLFDLVLSDMAPNLSGMDSVDQPRAMYLAELSMDLALNQMDRNGSFVCKLFQGVGFDAYIREARSIFRQLNLRKPEASRARSREVYVVCQGLK